MGRMQNIDKLGVGKINLVCKMKDGQPEEEV